MRKAFFSTFGTFIMFLLFVSSGAQPWPGVGGPCLCVDVPGSLSPAPLPPLRRTVELNSSEAS